MTRPRRSECALAAWALSTALAACGGSGTGSNASGQSSGTASSGARASSGSRDGSTATPGSGVATPRGCGLGTSCRPGNDLAIPPSADGFQIATAPGMITVQPGQEVFDCYFKTVSGAAEFDAGTFQSWMTAGSSRDLIVHQQATASQPDGTLTNCATATGNWIFAASLSGRIVELKMPDGVGVPLTAGGQVVLGMHWVNVGSSPVRPQVKLNVLRAQNFQYKAGAMVSFNASINVPAATAAGPGTQTVTGRCTAPVGSKFFAIGTHTRAHATVADVNLVSNGLTTNIVHTTDWSYCDVGVWTAPQFLTTQSGDSFGYSCAYANQGTTAVTVGETELASEACMTVGYYFPAGGSLCM